MGWLPPGKRAGICFSIDDVHPGKISDGYDGGGELGQGALGLVARLLEKHPHLRVTLFTTPDWRETGPTPTRTILARIPFVRDRVHLTKLRPRGSMRLDRHPQFVAYLRSLPRTEVALHGLHHIHRGRIVVVEFQDQSVAECESMLRESMSLFRRAELPFVSGMAPPGWNAPPNLLRAMRNEGLRFIASARDIRTPVAAGARAHMSGLHDVLLFEPELIEQGQLVHISSNFQATSDKERAIQIIESGGLLCVKAHIIKNAHGHVALDGVDATYCNYLDALFTLLEDRYGDELFWTSMSEVADRVLSTSTRPSKTDLQSWK